MVARFRALCHFYATSADSVGDIENLYDQLLPPQGFGPEAKTRGGTLAFPGCIHTRTKNICC